MSHNSLHEHYLAMSARTSQSADAQLLSMAKALSMTSAVLLDTDGYGNRQAVHDDYQMLRELSAAYTVPLEHTEEGFVEVTGVGSQVSIEVNLGFTERPRSGMRRRCDPGSLFTVDQDEEGVLKCTALVFPYSAQRLFGKLNDPKARIYRGEQNPPGLFYPARALWLGRAAVKSYQ